MYETRGPDIDRTLTDIGQPEETSNKHQDQVALSGFLSPTKHVIRQSKKRKQLRKVAECSWKILVFCNQYRSFYACYSKLNKEVHARVSMQYCTRYPDCKKCEEEAFEVAEEAGLLSSFCYCEKWIDDEVEARLEASEEDLRRTYNVESPALVWRKGEKIFASCKCRPTRISDDWIEDRKPLTEMAKYAPCNFRCNSLQDARECWYQKEQTSKAQRIQIELTRYLPRTKKKVVL